MDIGSARLLLGLEAGFSRGEVTTAFRCRMVQAHPDNGGQPDVVRALVEARQVLLSHLDRRRGDVVAVDDSTTFQKLVRRYRRKVRRRSNRVF